MLKYLSDMEQKCDGCQAEKESSFQNCLSPANSNDIREKE